MTELEQHKTTLRVKSARGRQHIEYTHKMQQQPSPNISSPSTSFMSPRASPLFVSSVEQQGDPAANSSYEYRGDVQYQQPGDSESSQAAPPKQVAQAMEHLAQLGRLIAQVRLGADRFMEAIFEGSDIKMKDPDSDKAAQLVVSEDVATRRCLDDIKTIGRILEESRVLIGSQQRLQESPWGLHMPLVCPDGAIVAYAWKRQLAGQAAASAVDRTRLALKAFTDQKRRFFPHLEERTFGNVSNGESGSAKKSCHSFPSPSHPRQDMLDKSDEQTILSDVLKCLDTEAPGMKISTYQRIEWFKKASSLVPFGSNSSSELTKQEQSHLLGKPPAPGVQLTSGSVPLEQVGVLDVLVPSVYRAVVSLTPAGSTIPDAVAFFSPDEVGNYIHARGFSIHNVYLQISKYAEKALQHFLHVRPHSSLDLLLHWLWTYESLFTKPCSKCERVLAMDHVSALLLPPVIRPYHQLLVNKNTSNQLTTSANVQTTDSVVAFHADCLPEEEL